MKLPLSNVMGSAAEAHRRLWRDGNAVAGAIRLAPRADARRDLLTPIGDVCAYWRESGIENSPLRMRAGRPSAYLAVASSP